MSSFLIQEMEVESEQGAKTRQQSLNRSTGSVPTVSSPDTFIPVGPPTL